MMMPLASQWPLQLPPCLTSLPFRLPGPWPCSVTADYQPTVQALLLTSRDPYLLSTTSAGLPHGNSSVPELSSTSSWPLGLPCAEGLICCIHTLLLALPLHKYSFQCPGICGSTKYFSISGSSGTGEGLACIKADRARFHGKKEEEGWPSS